MAMQWRRKTGDDANPQSNPRLVSRALTLDPTLLAGRNGSASSGRSSPKAALSGPASPTSPGDRSTRAFIALNSRSSAPMPLGGARRRFAGNDRVEVDIEGPARLEGAVAAEVALTTLKIANQLVYVHYEHVPSATSLSLKLTFLGWGHGVTAAMRVVTR